MPIQMSKINMKVKNANGELIDFDMLESTVPGAIEDIKNAALDEIEEKKDSVLSIISENTPQNVSQLTEDLDTIVNETMSTMQQLIEQHSDIQDILHAITIAKEEAIEAIQATITANQVFAANQEDIVQPINTLQSNISEFENSIRSEIDTISSNLTSETNRATEKEAEIENLLSVPAVQGYISNWLNNNSNKIVGIPNLSLTENKFTNDLKLKVLNNYVTPEMFKTNADGTTKSDTNALTDAFNYCKQNHVNLVTPRKTYSISSSCILDFGTTNFDCFFYGTFDNLTFKSNASIAGYRNIYIHSVTNNIKFINFKGLHAHIDSVNNFYLIGDGQGTGYNYFTGLLWERIYLQAFNSGWVNENHFSNIRTWYLNIRGSTNNFYDMGMESTTQKQSKIIFNGSAHHNYIRVRGEGDYVLTESTSSYGNIIETTYQGDTPLWSLRQNRVSSSGRTLKAYERNKYIQVKKLYNIDISNYSNNSNDTVKKQIFVANNTTLCKVYLDLSKCPCQLHIFSDQNIFKYKIKILNNDFQNITEKKLNYYNGTSSPNKTTCVFLDYKSTFDSTNSLFRRPALSSDSVNRTDEIYIPFAKKANTWAEIQIFISNPDNEDKFRTLQVELESFIAMNYFVTNLIN